MVFRMSRWFGGDRKEPPTVTATFDDGGIVFGDGRSSIKLPWSEIQRIVVFVRSSNIGYTNCMLLEGANDRLIELNEQMPLWETLLANIERHLNCTMNRAQWETRLVADPTAQIVLCSKDGGGTGPG